MGLKKNDAGIKASEDQNWKKCQYGALTGFLPESV